MRTIAITNQKGGIGKTTTAQVLIEALRSKGFKVLGIDADTQSNLTFALKEDAHRLNLIDLYRGQHAINELIENDFISSNSDTVRINIDKTNINALKQALKGISKLYDYCIIDCPPLINALVLSVLVACDKAIICTNAESFSLNGSVQTIKACHSAKVKEIEMLFTFYNERTPLNVQLKASMEENAKAQGFTVYKTTIRKGIDIAKAQTLRKPILTYSKSKVIQDYKAFVDEFSEREREIKQ